VDFAREFDAVRSFLTDRGFRVAVIGGVALAAYGHPRLTLDLDIVTEAAGQEALVRMMEANGFITLHRSEGYSNHRHPDRIRGRVDVMYVRGETADRLFASMRDLPGPGGNSIPVPKPEHLIAMKVRSIKDAPERTWQDLADIGYLLRIDGVDRAELEAISNALASRRSGVRSPKHSDPRPIDLDRDVPTTPADIAAFRRLRQETPSWLFLSAAEIEALIPDNALDTRPTTPPGARPFTLAPGD